MPARWVINPLIEEVGPEGTYRYPKVSRLLDPGRVGKFYRHSSVIADGVPWCLSLVRGADLSPLATDPDCIDFLEEDGDTPMHRTLSDLNWSAAKRHRIRMRLEDKGVDTSSYSGSTPLRQVVRDLARALQPMYPGPEANSVS